MGSKGSQTVTQSGNQNQSYTPNQPILGMTQNAGQMATTAAQAPFQQPTAPVAPFTPFQSIGFGETLGLQGMAQPYFNTAGNYLAGSAAPVTGSDVQNYYNPMAANVTAQLQNIFGQQNVQNTGNLVNAAGGVGADRVAVGQANLANQQTLAAGQTYAGLYQQALQAAEQNKQMQAGAGFAFGQMGPAAQAAQQNAVNQLLGVGAQQQGLNQQQLNAIYQNQLARIAYPFQTAQYLSGITAGLAPAVGGKTEGSYSGQTTYPSPSPFAQALGVGTGLLGMFGGMGGFGGFGGGGYGSGAPMQWSPNYGPGAYGNGNSYPYYEEGGAVDDNYGNLANREKYQEYAKIIPAAAQGNPAAETFLKDVGYDDGGGIDQTIGQPAPMSLNIDPTNTGLPFPGAGRVGKSVVPTTQLPTGQGGRSGLYGQQMIMHPPPSMPSGGGQQQSPMSGAGLGQLGGSLGKMLGGLGGGGANAAADTGISAADWAAMGLDYPTDGHARGGEAPGAPQDTRSGYLLDNAKRWQGFESRFPKDTPPEEWIMPPGVIGNRGATSAGGAVGRPNRHWDYLQPMQPQAFDDGGTADDYIPPTGAAVPALKPFSLPPSVPMSEAPPGSVPEMGLGERGVTSNKDQSRFPDMTTPAVAAPSVPVPAPKPVQTVAVKPDQPTPKPEPRPPGDTDISDYNDTSKPMSERTGTAAGVSGWQSTGVENGPTRPFPTGPMGSFQRPFPEATDPNNFARRTTGSPWMALVNAGAQMAQTRGPIGSVIGAGLQAGARTLEGQRQALDNEEAVNQKAEHLALIAQAHLDQYSRMTPYQQGELEDRRKRTELMQDRLGLYTAAEHKQAYDQFPGDDAEQHAERMRMLYPGRDVGRAAQPAGPPAHPNVGDTYDFKQGRGRWDGKQWVPDSGTATG